MDPDKLRAEYVDSDEIVFAPWSADPRSGTGDALPGLDEVVLLTPGDHVWCGSRKHKQLGLFADAVAWFGHFGRRYYDNDSLWSECWGRQYAFCEECWDITLAVLTDRRPGLKVIDKRVNMEAPGPE